MIRLSESTLDYNARCLLDAREALDERTGELRPIIDDVEADPVDRAAARHMLQLAQEKCDDCRGDFRAALVSFFAAKAAGSRWARQSHQQTTPKGEHDE